MNLPLSVFAAVLIAARLGQAQNYIAEVSFFADDEVVKKYERELQSTRTQAEAELRKDIDYILTETNKLLQTLEGLNFQVRVRSLNILNSNIFRDELATPSVLIGSQALETAEQWLMEQGFYDKLEYDAVIFWTGFDVMGYTSILSTGFGYNGGGCDPSKALSIVEFNATYATAVATAKQIVKIFGGSESGPAYEDVVIRFNSPLDKDRWSFNPCTNSDIQAFIYQLSTNCLLTTSPESTTPNVSPASYTGRMFDPDVICQRALNDDRTYMAKLGQFYEDRQPGGDNVCQAILCWVPDSPDPMQRLFRHVYPSEGMLCDGSQRCDNGVCGSGVPATDNCVFGNQRKLYFPQNNFHGSCQELVDQFGMDTCYDESIRAACCETCVPIYPGYEECEFGDRSTQCINYSRSSVCPVYGDEVCCGYCRDFKRKRSVFTPLSERVNITVDIFRETSSHIVEERVYDIED